MAPRPSTSTGISGISGNDLAGLKRRDVCLVYIESYGTTVFDTPEFRTELRGPLTDFESAVRAAGYTMASSRLVSPTPAPAVVGGELKQWSVPVHVLSRDPELIAPFISAGYVAGLVPPPGAPAKGMESFLPSFLAAFGIPTSSVPRLEP